MACLTPISFKKNGNQPVPCGKCFECRKSKVRAWSFRIMQELKKCDYAYFATLTYNDRNLPVTEHGFPTLDKEGVQRFIKRLRKLIPAGRKKIVYYCAAEYGGKTQRPHYHFIIFNATHIEIEKAWSEVYEVQADGKHKIRGRNRSIGILYPGLSGKTQNDN